LPTLARLKLPLLVHAELPGPIAAVEPFLNGRDWRQYATWLASRPDEAEVAAIRLLIDLCREFGAPIHIVHLASAVALPMLRDAKAEGLPITVETCPHYLYFSSEQVPDGRTDFKCAPPLRDEGNRDHLRAAVLDGTIDLIASDHSPCPPQMKGLAEGRFDTAWGGIASLSLGASAVWTALAERGVPLSLLAQKMSSAPAALAGLSTRKGQIAPGFDADFTDFAPEESFTVTAADLHFRHRVSPYLGERLTGRVKQTILRGHRIFAGGAFPEPPRGREVLP
jgi:allantoinase